MGLMDNINSCCSNDCVREIHCLLHFVPVGFFYICTVAQCQAPTDTHVEQIMLEILINNFFKKKTCCYPTTKTPELKPKQKRGQMTEIANHIFHMRI